MKRDMNLIRELLLRLEGLPKTSHMRLHIGSDDERLIFESYTPDQVDYHMALLYEVEMITSSDSIDAMASGEWVFDALTWSGHDFLDTVRDPDVWKETKSRASQIGGWTLDIVKDLARAYLKQKAQQLGFG
ncbi:DUF2513 domain-containing protein [Methylobacterium sp. J-026]|uniref:DUF2513 domain-containing protein n=1 Tax=Methylobacterium sp. J-026 TaxID=2836624 RepID=UPI001FBABADB|nr:DUF2513 domain-containing protein [Methylobacterium sp. J-026]MCJ2136065.1 DUF2513 domain-containing protein [Methylobacterium sp. J-026]